MNFCFGEKYEIDDPPSELCFIKVIIENSDSIMMTAPFEKKCGLLAMAVRKKKIHLNRKSKLTGIKE